MRRFDAEPYPGKNTKQRLRETEHGTFVLYADHTYLLRQAENDAARWEREADRLKRKMQGAVEVDPELPDGYMVYAGRIPLAPYRSKEIAEAACVVFAADPHARYSKEELRVEAFWTRITP